MKRRLLALLRSRRLAATLILAFGAWAALGTIVPQATRDPAASAHWIARAGAVGAVAAALGLDHAFSSPILLGIALALFASTSACAFERTRPLVRAVRVGVGLGPAHVALIGSAVFHWSLALLFVIVGLGQLTRSEGLMGVVVGSSRLDTRESYGLVSEGPWHSATFTGLTIAVTDIELDHMRGGVNVGAAPLVEVYDGPELIERQLVYPNHPLRYRSLMIHSNAYGLAAVLVTPDGSRTELLFDYSDDDGLARALGSLEIEGEAGPISVDMVIPLDPAEGGYRRALPAEPRIEYSITRPDGSTSSGVAREGEYLAEAGDAPVRVERITYYARLSVVDDWSVTPMYVLFASATLGCTVALLVPRRAPRRSRSEGGDGSHDD